MYFLEMEIGTFSCNRITTIFLSYLKRCICCWYWVRVLLCRTLLSYKMFETNIRPSCDFFHSKKCTTTSPNPTLTFFPSFALVWETGSKRHLSESEYLLSLLHVPQEQCLVAPWDFFFSPTKFCFSLDSTIEICSTDWHCLYYILKPSLRDNQGNLFLALISNCRSLLQNGAQLMSKCIHKVLNRSYFASIV